MQAKCEYGCELKPALINGIVDDIVASHARSIRDNIEPKVIHGLKPPKEKIDKRVLLGILFYQNDGFIEDILNEDTSNIYFFDLELIYLLLLIAELVNADTAKLIAICCNNGIKVSGGELHKYLLKKEILELTFQYVENKSGLMSFFGMTSNILIMDDFIKGKDIQHNPNENTIEGVIFNKVIDVANEYNINPDTLYKRQGRGYRNDGLVFLKNKKTPSLQEVEIPETFIAGGVRYKSAAEACRALNIKYGTYSKRKEKGLTIAQALGLEAVEDGRGIRGVKFDVGGGMRSIQELSELHNIPSSTIRNRLKRGANIKQALSMEKIIRGSLTKQKEVPKKERSAIRLKVFGKQYNSYKSLADAYDMKAYTVRQRIVISGYTPEEAVSLNGKYNPLVVEGEKYSSKTEFAEAFGLTIQVLQGRLDHGSTVEQAVGIELRETKHSIWFEDKHYNSLVDLANKKNIPIGALRSRINSMSLQEAVEAGDFIRNPGRYNETILKRNSELANRPAWFYVAKLFIGGNYRYKIGITTDSVTHRLKAIGYKFEIIESNKETLIECYYFEQTLLKIFSRKRDFNVTSDMLDGYSEVLNLNQSELDFISEIINDN